MTEHDVCKSNEEKVSLLITSTCQLVPKSFSVASNHMHDLSTTENSEPKEYVISCGSAVEFYIRPMQTCMADSDFLSCKTDELAFSGDFPVLPSDMSGLADTIQCYKIEPCHVYPGFVRVRVFGKMNYNWKYKKYEIIYDAHPDKYVALDLTSLAISYSLNETPNLKRHPYIVSGPAIRRFTNSQIRYDTRRYDKAASFPVDDVKSLFCPQWPKDAQHWPIRSRNYGWPTTATISEVVQNGCHVVYVQHRSCRDDKQQWRFSFSLAEVFLLQSWTQTQQIVYHLLKFFANKELIQIDCPKEDEVLCSYHLKTLMLWTCEEMSPEWWNSSCIISICCELLRKLSDWLKRRYFPNYFIPEANLFHEPSTSTTLDKTERRLNEFCNSGTLWQWFLENYLMSFFRTSFKIPTHVDITSQFEEYMVEYLYLRRVRLGKSLDLALFNKFEDSHRNCRLAIKCGGSGLRRCLKFAQNGGVNTKIVGKMTYLQTITKVLCFKYYDILLFILHVAYALCYEELSLDSSLFVEFVEAISMQPKIIRSQYHNFPKTYKAQSGWYQFLRAQDLMQNLTGSNSRSEFQLVSLMSKELLRKALESDGSKSNGIAPAALAYLAALHFATSEYQPAIRFCSAVLADQTSHKEQETLNAGCLLFIDDIATIVGLYLLHTKITNDLHYIGRQLYLDLRLSTEVFAQYLTALSADRIYTHFDLYHDLPHSAFPVDEYVKALIILRKQKFTAPMKSGIHFNAARQIVHRRLDSFTETGDTALGHFIVKETAIYVLMECALKNMTSFYNVIREDFGIQCNTADCYRALHLYKCCHYDEVWHLCERILHEPDLESNLKKLALANVLVIPPIDSFFDRDVQSLLGFHTLFYYLSPLNDDMAKCELALESKFEFWFARYVYSQRL